MKSCASLARPVCVAVVVEDDVHQEEDEVSDGDRVEGGTPDVLGVQVEQEVALHPVGLVL